MCVCVLSLVQGWFRLVSGWFRVCSVGLRYVLRGWFNQRLVYGWFRVD